MAFARQNKQTMILVTQKSVGPSFVNPSVVFKNPFEATPVTIARIKKIYPDNKLMLFIILFQRVLATISKTN